jgi:hypothetical protein
MVELFLIAIRSYRWAMEKTRRCARDLQEKFPLGAEEDVSGQKQGWVWGAASVDVVNAKKAPAN